MILVTGATDLFRREYEATATSWPARNGHCPPIRCCPWCRAGIFGPGCIRAPGRRGDERHDARRACGPVLPGLEHYSVPMPVQPLNAQSGRVRQQLIENRAPGA
jgi:hypothetical protein